MPFYQVLETIIRDHHRCALRQGWGAWSCIRCVNGFVQKEEGDVVVANFWTPTPDELVARDWLVA